MDNPHSKDLSDSAESGENLPSKKFSIDERFDFRVAPEPAPRDTSKPPNAETIQDTGLAPSTTPGELPDENDGNDPLIGQSVGNFEVTQRLGRGGFGSVYKARDVKLNRNVALKFLRFPLDPEYRKLFTREAQVLANLSQHPAIVQVYTWGEFQGSYYFALEFVDGSAEALLGHLAGKLPVRRALEVVSQCADALHYAHENGVLHRDIKPANILIDSKSGRAKLCDFGLARFRNLGVGASTAHLAGSPPYMAPEQVMGNAIDARTDVYGLGVTLYELLSGRLPFEGDSQANILERIRKGKDVPLAERRPDLAPSVIKLVRRAMAWNPRDRFQSAAEFKHAVDRMLAEMDSSGSAARPAIPRILVGTRSRMAGRVAAAACVAAAALLAGMGYWRISSGGTRSPAPDSVWPVAAAQAREMVDAGKLDEARAALETYLVQQPGDDYATYVLGFTHFLLGNFEDAANLFLKIKEPGLRLEGTSALRHAQNSEEARPSLEDAVTLVPTRYPAVLLASLDVFKGDWTSAVTRLETVQAERLNFEWQRRDFHRLYGQALLSLGKVEDAQTQLGMLPVDDPVTGAMLGLIARQQDTEARSAISEQVQRIASEVRSAGDKPRDRWTSRPLRVRIEPPGKVEVHSQYARDMARHFPSLLAERMDNIGDRPLEVVDRQFIGDTLAEQEYSKLAPTGDEVRIGQLLGARIMIESEFGTFFGDEFAQITLVDTETSRKYQLEKMPFRPGFVKEDVEAWLLNAVRLIHDELSDREPLKGRLSVENGQARINIGSRIGVAEGMAFVAYAREDSGMPLQGVTIRVVPPVDADFAAVAVEGASLQAASAGWVVREVASEPP